MDDDDAYLRPFDDGELEEGEVPPSPPPAPTPAPLAYHDAPAWAPLPPPPAPVAPPPPRHEFLEVVCLRRRRAWAGAWVEALLARSRDGASWVWPQVALAPGSGIHGAGSEFGTRLVAAVHLAAQRMLPKLNRGDGEALRRRLAAGPPDNTVTHGRTTTVVLELEEAPWASNAAHVAPSCPPGPVVWALESELATSEAMGAPGVWGLPVSPFALAHWEAAVPPGKAFATLSPPLVLYHGTGAAAAAAIAASSLKPSAQSRTAMLGPGVYLARWAKALDFAGHDVDNVARHEPGVVVRVAVCVPPDTGVYVMTPGDVCTCGCGRAYVDHNGVRTGMRPVVAAMDGSGAATRRAEWCVRECRCMTVLGLAKVGMSPAGL
jgi:hypothetical protein